MYKKQLTDLTLVGLKHFFNLDPFVVTQLFIMLLLTLVIFRQQIAEAFNIIGKELYKIKEHIKADLNAPQLKLHFLRR